MFYISGAKPYNKFDQAIFDKFYVLNAATYNTFHFYSLLLLKLGFRTNLYAKVKAELARINNIASKYD